MIGKILIDGIDIYSEFGVYAVDGGLCGLLSWPSLKQPDTIDYPDENGIEVDLEYPALSSKTFTIQLATSSNVDDFLNFIQSSVYHVWEFPLLGIHRKLRFISVPEFDSNLFAIFNLELADDFPISGRNLVENPILNTDSNVYGFAIRNVSLVGGKKYRFTINGNIANAQNGKYLRAYLYEDTWQFAVDIECKSKTSRSISKDFIAPYTGVFTIASYYYDSSLPRTGSVRLNWYKLEEYGLQDYQYKAPISYIIQEQGLTLDNKDISEYGVSILDGTKDEILKPFPIKQNLISDSKYTSGSTCEDDVFVYGSKDVKLKLCIEHWSVKKMMRNFNALLYDLTRSGYIQIGFNGNNYRTFYKSSQVTKTHFGRIIYFEFELTMTFTKQL